MNCDHADQGAPGTSGSGPGAPAHPGDPRGARATRARLNMGAVNRMYMVVWAAAGGDLSQNRAWFRRRGAERRAAKLNRRIGPNTFRVEQVPFWSASAFWPTVLLYGLVPLLATISVVTVVLVLEGRL